MNNALIINAQSALTTLICQNTHTGSHHPFTLTSLPNSQNLKVFILYNSVVRPPSFHIQFALSNINPKYPESPILNFTSCLSLLILSFLFFWAHLTFSPRLNEAPMLLLLLDHQLMMALHHILGWCKKNYIF